MGQHERLARNVQSWRRVTVTEVRADSLVVRDQFGNYEEVPHYQKAKGLAPEVGEFWAIDRTHGIWMLSAYLGKPTGGGGASLAQVNVDESRSITADDIGKRLRATTDLTLTLVDEAASEVGEFFELYAAGGDVEVFNDPDSQTVFEGGSARIYYDATGQWLIVDYGGVSGIVFVEHGADASFARPNADVVYWRGTVTPTNAEDGDFLNITA